MAGMAAAGAAAGTAIMPGIGTAIGGVAGALMDGFMGGTGSGGSAGPAGPGAAAVAVYGSGLNGDNWNVNFRGTQSNTSSAYKPFAASGPTASTAGQGGYAAPAPSAIPGMTGWAGDMSLSTVPGWAWAVGVGLIAWRVLKSGK